MGMCSGSVEAVQLHIAFSKTFKAVGLFQGAVPTYSNWDKIDEINKFDKAKPQ